MSEQLWYYVDNAQTQHGPITIPELQGLVANHMINQQTIVWTEALGEQWIPASNVEGLFPEQVEVAPNPETASIAVKAPAAYVDPAVVAAEIAQAAAPPLPTAETAPTLVAPNLQPAAVAAPAPAPVQAQTVSPQAVVAAPVPVQPQQPQLTDTALMIPSTPTTQPVAGTPVEAPAPAAVEAVAEAPAEIPAAPSMPVGTVDFSAVADVAPIPAGTAAVTVKANPLLAAGVVIAKPKSLLGVQAGAKTNPLLANAAAAIPQNKLNTSIPAAPPAEAPAEPNPG